MTIQEVVDDSSTNASEGHSADEVIERTRAPGNPNLGLADVLCMAKSLVCNWYISRYAACCPCPCPIPCPRPRPWPLA